MVKLSAGTSVSPAANRAGSWPTAGIELRVDALEGLAHHVDVVAGRREHQREDLRLLALGQVLGVRRQPPDDGAGAAEHQRDDQQRPDHAWAIQCTSREHPRPKGGADAVSSGRA
jgi:hypothetical protein